MIGELIVLFNFFFNIILLRFTQAVTRYPIKTWRLISSAFCSALIAVVFYESIVMTIFSFIVLIGIAFSFRWSSFYVQGSWLMMGTLLAGVAKCGSTLFIETFHFCLYFVLFRHSL